MIEQNHDLKVAVEAEPLKAGVYDGVPRAVYESWNAINFSRLKGFARTAAHAKHAMDFPSEPTEALDIGQATHSAILEPEKFSQEYAAAPKIDRRYKDGRKAWKDFQEANADKIILGAEDFQICEAMRDAIWDSDSVAKALLESPGRNERSFVWQDPETHLWCKGRCDRMVKWSGWPVVIDLKTARAADIDGFGRDIDKYRYHVQAAWYLYGLDQLAHVKRRWMWVVLEKESPWLHAIYEPAERLLQQGERVFRRWLADYAECVRTGYWPGYDGSPQSIDIPRWSQDKDPNFQILEAS